MSTHPLTHSNHPASTSGVKGWGGGPSPLGLEEWGAVKDRWVRAVVASPQTVIKVGRLPSFQIFIRSPRWHGSGSIFLYRTYVPLFSPVVILVAEQMVIHRISKLQKLRKKRYKKAVYIKRKKIVI